MSALVLPERGSLQFERALGRAFAPHALRIGDQLPLLYRTDKYCDVPRENRPMVRRGTPAPRFAGIPNDSGGCTHGYAESVSADRWVDVFAVSANSLRHGRDAVLVTISSLIRIEPLASASLLTEQSDP